MQKNILVLLFLFFALPLFSQVKTGDIVLSLDGSYMKTNTGGGFTTNMWGTQAKNLRVGLSAGYFFSERFVAGVGLDYSRDKELRSNLVTFNNSSQMEEMDYLSHAWLPNVYLGLYFPVVSKFYITANFKTSYGKINTRYTSSYASIGNIVVGSPVSSSVHVISSDAKVDYFSNMIYPELLYFLGSKTSISLMPGGIQYVLTGWDTHNAEVAVNFNPVYWKLGLRLKL